MSQLVSYPSYHLHIQDHPNIIKMYDFYSDRKNYYLITELCVGGTLFDKIMQEKFLPEIEAASIMKQILSAVNYLHQSNILHRDLKPEIMMFDAPGPSGILKISDFGISREFSAGETIT